MKIAHGTCGHHTGADAEPEAGPPILLQVIQPDVDVDEDVKQFEFVRRASSQTDVGNQRGEEQADDVQEDDAGGNTRMRRSAWQNQFNYAMEAEDVPSDTYDEYYDPSVLVDNDNEIGDGDDDLYADNVDEDEPGQKQDNKSNEREKHERKSSAT